PVKHGSHPGPVLLQARRLIEAGVSVVTVCVFGAGPWDTHRHNFITLRELLPPLDQALTALITDLDERGLLPDVAVVMGGEFGRTPRIGDATPDGRSHWPEAGFLWVAGGGLKTGQVNGATDARGEQPVGRPIRMQPVLATLYRVLGIDPVRPAATLQQPHKKGRCSRDTRGVRGVGPSVRYLASRMRCGDTGKIGPTVTETRGAWRPTVWNCRHSFTLSSERLMQPHH